jgi:hypothetical protein
MILTLEGRKVDAEYRIDVLSKKMEMLSINSVEYNEAMEAYASAAYELFDILDMENGKSNKKDI